MRRPSVRTLLIVAFLALAAGLLVVGSRTREASDTTPASDANAASRPASRESAPHAASTAAPSSGNAGVAPAANRPAGGPGMRAVEIVPLGDEPPGIDRSNVLEGFAGGRERFRACMESAGGVDALIAAMSANPASYGRRLELDVGPDGRAVIESIALDGPYPAPFDRCYLELAAGANFPSVGADGARITIPLRVLRRAGATSSMDGGVSGG